jgi:hypothetical protein
MSAGGETRLPFFKINGFNRLQLNETRLKDAMIPFRVAAASIICISVIGLAVSSCTKEQAAVPATDVQKKTANNDAAKKEVRTAKEKGAALVNGAEISMHDLVREMNRIAPKYKKKESPVFEPTAKIQDEALNRLIFAELVVQEATRQGITVDTEMINHVIVTMKNEMGDDAYRKYLEDRDVTEQELREHIERGHLFEMATAKNIYSKIAINEGEVRKEFDANRRKYRDAAGHEMNFDQAADHIRRKLIAKRGAVMMRNWEKSLRKNSNIVITSAVQTRQK